MRDVREPKENDKNVEPMTKELIVEERMVYD